MVAISECVLHQGDDSVDIILGEFADVFKDKTERLETSSFDVEFRNTVLVHDSG